MKTYQDYPIIGGQRQIVLRVREIMASRGIRSVSELHRRLISNGVEISNAQLLRICDNRGDRVNMPVLNGLLNLLECSVHDLFGEQIVDSSTSPVATHSAK
jgi:DNA-binding Xre family transcriptional regulator